MLTFFWFLFGLLSIAQNAECWSFRHITVSGLNATNKTPMHDMSMTFAFGVWGEYFCIGVLGVGISSLAFFPRLPLYMSSLFRPRWPWSPAIGILVISRIMSIGTIDKLSNCSSVWSVAVQYKLLFTGWSIDFLCELVHSYYRCEEVIRDSCVV